MREQMSIKTQATFEEIVFIDIETVPNKEHNKILTEILKENDTLRETPGLYAEFARIACISVGYYTGSIEVTEISEFRVRSYVNRIEAGLLTDFFRDMQLFLPGRKYIGGHNIKEFDIPFIIKRALINDHPIPELFQISNKKPWELKQFVDTMEMWALGSYQNKWTSLRRLCGVFDLPDPKQETEATEVEKLYYAGDLDSIIQYCEGDVVAAAKVYCKLIRRAFPRNINLTEINSEIKYKP